MSPSARPAPRPATTGRALPSPAQGNSAGKKQPLPYRPTTTPLFPHFPSPSILKG